MSPLLALRIGTPVALIAWLWLGWTAAVLKDAPAPSYPSDAPESALLPVLGLVR